MLRRMAVYSLAIEAMVRGYHVYQSIGMLLLMAKTWNALERLVIFMTYQL